MAGGLSFTTEELHTLLSQAVRYGARAQQLHRKSPELVEMLCPAARHLDLTPFQRARSAETVIQRGIKLLGGNAGRALATALCLVPGLLRTTLTYRRSLAAEYLGVTARTFREPSCEGSLLFDLADTIERLLNTEVHPASSTS